MYDELNNKIVCEYKNTGSYLIFIIKSHVGGWNSKI